MHLLLALRTVFCRTTLQLNKGLIRNSVVCSMSGLLERYTLLLYITLRNGLDLAKKLSVHQADFPKSFALVKSNGTQVKRLTLRVFRTSVVPLLPAYGHCEKQAVFSREV